MPFGATCWLLLYSTWVAGYGRNWVRDIYGMSRPGFVRVVQGVLPSCLWLAVFWRGETGWRHTVYYLALLSQWQEAGKRLFFLSSFKKSLVYACMMCACAQCLCGSQRTTWCGFWDQSQVPRLVWQVSYLTRHLLFILPTWTCFFPTKRTSGLSWAWQSNILHKLTFRMSSPWRIKFIQ